MNWLQEIIDGLVAVVGVLVPMGLLWIVILKFRRK